MSDERFSTDPAMQKTKLGDPSRAQSVIIQWLESAPEWLQRAYRNDMATNRIVYECAYLGKTKEEMILSLLEEMMSQRDALRQKCFEYAQAQPLVILKP